MEDFLVAWGHGNGDEPRHRKQSHPDPAEPTHFHEDRGGHDERDYRKQLVRDAEKRPERIDAAERIDNPLIEKVAPERDDDGPGNKNPSHPPRAPQALPTPT